MIAKVKVTENIWEYFDNAQRVNVQIHYPAPGSAAVFPAIGCREDVCNFTDRPCSEDEHRNGIVELWLYGKENDDTRQIMAYRPAYLLNENGKTVERI